MVAAIPAKVQCPRNKHELLCLKAVKERKFYVFSFFLQLCALELIHVVEFERAFWDFETQFGQPPQWKVMKGVNHVIL